MKNNATKILKESGSDMKYQSTFLPIFQKAETKIKTLIILALFLMVVSEFNLRLQIMQVINFVDSKIPKDLPNREAYLQGLVRRSEFWLRTLYKPQKERFEEEKRAVKDLLPERQLKDFAKHSSNPKELKLFVEKNSSKLDMWATQKGYPNVTDYPKELKKTIKKLADQPMTTYEPGKKPISLWQKAELDTRYFNQMQHLQDLRTQGEDLCYISSHPNCSKRCEKWQGKLVSLSKHSNLANFVVGNVDNHTVYSLPDIMAQVDKYGYHNNIICGFSCRHRLIPYRHQNPPNKYDNKEVAKQREIELKIRELERKIRVLKTNEHLYNESGDKITAKYYHERAKELISTYKKFCEDNGYSWQQYRIDI